MSTVIKSGRNGNTAHVNNDEQLQTFAVTQSQEVSSGIKGQIFLLTHPAVNLTSSNESFIFYGKNDDTMDWIISNIRTVYGPSAGGAGGDILWRSVIGATEGTLIDAGTPVEAVNLNIGNAQQLPSTLLVGVEGDTVTDGVSLVTRLVPRDSFADIFRSVPVILPTGSSFAFGVTPPVGNTGMNVQFEMTIIRDIGI